MAVEPDGYVVYGSVPWDTPWLTEQNLAAALAEHRPVLYVEPPITPLTPFRYGLGRDSPRLARALARRGLRRSGRTTLFRPLTLPPRSHPRARALARPLLRRQLARAVADAGLRRPVAVWGHANMPLHGAAGELLSVALVKDWIEAGGELVGQEAGEIAASRRALWDRADLICATSTELVRTLERLGHPARLLRHGFHADLADAYDDDPPPEYRDLPRPLLGYAGRIDGRLDFDALGAVADRFRGGSVVLVGPVSPRAPQEEVARLAQRPNVHLLGVRTRERLPAYLAALDCSLLPYRPGEWSRHGSPLKLWDYLYAGPPIVGAGYLALREYPPPLVRFVAEADAFAAAVDAALRADRGRDERRAFALANSWADRARELERLVAEALARVDAGRARSSDVEHGVDRDQQREQRGRGAARRGVAAAGAAPAPAPAGGAGRGVRRPHRAGHRAG